MEQLDRAITTFDFLIKVLIGHKRDNKKVWDFFGTEQQGEAYTNKMINNMVDDLFQGIKALKEKTDLSSFEDDFIATLILDENRLSRFRQEE